MANLLSDLLVKVQVAHTFLNAGEGKVLPDQTDHGPHDLFLSLQGHVLPVKEAFNVLGIRGHETGQTAGKIVGFVPFAAVGKRVDIPGVAAVRGGMDTEDDGGERFAAAGVSLELGGEDGIKV